MLEKLSERLLVIASLVKGDVLADVGTDHAYLPISLIKEEKIRFAIASDIHAGPVQRAKINIASHGCEEKTAVVHTNGLTGLENYHPTDIVIAGMGGDLIAQILENASWVKNSAYHLILQPMTKAHHLRNYLWENGFLIEKECFVKEDTRVYQILSCNYRGVIQPHTVLETYIGKEDAQIPSEIRCDFFKQIRIVFEKRLAGLSLAQKQSDEEAKWLQSAIELLIRKGNEL